MIDMPNNLSNCENSVKSVFYSSDPLTLTIIMTGCYFYWFFGSLWYAWSCLLHEF